MADFFFRGLVVKPNCDNCPLQGSRIVPPEGNLLAKVAIIGEAPGENEEIEGRPFIGTSGKHLDMILARLGVKRGDIWISNGALCKPRPQARSYKAKCPTCKGKKGAAAAAALCTLCSGTGATTMRKIVGSDAILREAVVQCSPRLKEEIRRLPNLKVVVPLGNRAFDTFVPGHSGISKHRGAVHFTKITKQTDAKP